MVQPLVKCLCHYAFDVYLIVETQGRHRFLIQTDVVALATKWGSVPFSISGYSACEALQHQAIKFIGTLELDIDNVGDEGEKIRRL